MSEKVSLDDSEGRNSHQSDETSSDNYYCEVDNDDLESDEKSVHSHDGSVSNTTHSDVVIQQIDNVITKEKTFLDYSADVENMEIRKPTSFKRNCCKLMEKCFTGAWLYSLLKMIISQAFPHLKYCSCCNNRCKRLLVSGGGNFEKNQIRSNFEIGI